MNEGEAENLGKEIREVAFLGLKGLPYGGGAESVADGIIRYLDPSCFHATVYCDERLVPRNSELPNTTLVFVPSLPGKYLRATSHFISATIHALLHGNYDVIHLHNVEASYVLPLLRTKYRRIVATSHGQAQAREKWSRAAKSLMALMEYPFMRIPEEVTCVSETLSEYYAQRYGRSVRYIPNGVEDQDLQDSAEIGEVLDKYGLQPGYIMFAAGRIIPSKGAHTLLEAFQGIDYPDARVLIVGDERQMPDYSAHLRKLADDRVTFIPFIAERKEVAALVQASRFFVFPSTIEAMSMMLLQVSSLGVPIVFSDIPENLSVLGHLGTVFTTGDSDDLRAKLKFTWENPNDVKHLAVQARRHVHLNFSWDSISEQYAKMYQK